MNVVRHDFTKPARLANEWQNRLGAWIRLAFASANKAWAKELPFPIEATLLDLDVGYAQKCLANLAEGAVGYRVLAADRRVPTLLTLPRLTLLKLIGAMLGDSESVNGDREMTVIEENLADYFFVHHWLPFFREAWPAEQLVGWELQPRDRNPQASRIFAAEDCLIVLNWQLRAPWGEDKGAWYFQRKGLCEALGEKAGSAVAVIPEPVVKARREAIVSSLPLVVEIVLGTADLKLSELSHLQVGDLVLLQQGGADGVVVRAGGQDLFRGVAGRLGSRKAFQIASNTES